MTYNMIVKDSKHRKHLTFIGSANTRSIKNEPSLARSESSCSEISNSYLQEVEQTSGIAQEVRNEIELRFKISSINLKYKFPRSETPNLPPRTASLEKTSYHNYMHRSTHSSNITPFKSSQMRFYPFELSKGHQTDRRTISPMFKPESYLKTSRIKRTNHFKSESNIKPKTELPKVMSISQALAINKILPKVTSEEEMKVRIKRIYMSKTRVTTPMRNNIK